MFNYLVADIFMNYCADSIKQSDLHNPLSTDPGSIRNGAHIYSSDVAGVTEDQEPEDKDYCNQKQNIHEQTSAYESDRMLSKFPDKDDVEREYDVQVDSNLNGHADKQRQSQIKGRLEAQANSEQRQTIINERMDARADIEQQKRVESIKSQTENKQRKSIVSERMKSQTENKQRESLIKERMKVQADNEKRPSCILKMGSLHLALDFQTPKIQSSYTKFHPSQANSCQSSRRRFYYI